MDKAALVDLDQEKIAAASLEQEKVCKEVIAEIKAGMEKYHDSTLVAKV